MQYRPETLDPPDWEPVRDLARRMFDDAVDYTRDVRERPVWQSMPPEVRAHFRSAAPQQGLPLEEVYAEIVTNMLHYPMGNIHPRFWLWYIGSRNLPGALQAFLTHIIGTTPAGGAPAAAE